MKTIKIFSALALTLAVASCDNFELPNPPAQSYPDPEGYFENSGLAMTATAEPLNLIEANEANTYVTVATIGELKNFPENYTLSIDMEVGNDAQFSKTVIVPTVIEGDNVTVNPDLLNGAIQSMLTRKPGQYDVNVRFDAYAERETTRLRLGGLDATYGAGVLDVTTLAAEKVIEDSYYLVPCDAAGNPNMSGAVKMNNTAGEGVSGYDNPEFALKFDVPAGTSYLWKIAPASALTAGSSATLYGGNPAEDGMSGKLGTSYSAVTVPIEGSVLLTANMETDAYTLSYAFEVLYPFSGSTKAENLMLLYTDNYINYQGVTAINQRWTLCTAADKSGVTFYQLADSEPEVTEVGEGMVQSGQMATQGGSLTAPVKGNTLYWCDVNLVQQTYTISSIGSISVIGDGNGWDTATATKLTPAKDLRTWTGTDIKIGSEFKLNCNGGWDLDFGGTQVPDAMGNLVYNIEYKGSNLPCVEGTYDVTVDFSARPYTVTLTKKN